MKSILAVPPRRAKVKDRDRTSGKLLLAEGTPWAFRWPLHPRGRGEGSSGVGGVGGRARPLHTQREGWWGAGCRQRLLSGGWLSLPPSERRPLTGGVEARLKLLYLIGHQRLPLNSCHELTVWSGTGPLTSELQDPRGSEGLVTLSQCPLDSERQATWPADKPEPGPTPTSCMAQVQPLICQTG